MARRVLYCLPSNETQDQRRRRGTRVAASWDFASKYTLNARDGFLQPQWGQTTQSLVASQSEHLMALIIAPCVKRDRPQFGHASMLKALLHRRQVVRYECTRDIAANKKQTAFCSLFLAFL